jgi:hypothetical protein
MCFSAGATQRAGRPARSNERGASMSPALKNGILIAIVAVILIAAGFTYKKKSADTGYSDDPNLATHWMCDETGEQFSLTPAKYQEWFTAPDRLRNDPNYPQGLLVFKNEKTGRYTIVRAEIDPVTKEWYIKTNSKGEPVPLPDKIKEARGAKARKK